MAKQTNIVILPSANDALNWYHGYNPGGDLPPYPDEGSVIVKTEDGSCLEPGNDYGIIFEKQFEKFGIYEGDANWDDQSGGEVKTLEVGADDDAYDVIVSTSYDDQDPDSVPVWWQVLDTEGSLVADGQMSGLINIWFGQNESPYPREVSFIVTFKYAAPDGEKYLFNEVELVVNQAGFEVQDGYIDPASSSVNYNSRSVNFTVMADNLYWEVTSKPGWVQSISTTGGSGTYGNTARFGNNNGAERIGDIEFTFYLDDEHTEVKNTATYSLTQVGRNREVASWSEEDSSVTNLNVSSGSGSTNIYIHNNPNNAYIKFTDRYGNDVTGTPETTAFTYSYPQAEYYDAESYSVEVGFYAESTFETLYRNSNLYLTQAGDESLPHIGWNSEQVPGSGGTVVLVAYLEGEAVSWMIQLDPNSDFVSFTDYPGQSEVTGDTTANTLSLTFQRNTNQWARSTNIYAHFYDQNGNEITSQSVYIQQAKGEYVGTAYFNEGGGDWLNISGRFTGDVYVTVEPESGIYYKLEDESGNTISTGNTSASTVLTTITGPNLTGQDIQLFFFCMFYDDASLTDMVGGVQLTLLQSPAQEEIYFDCAFVTTADSQTLKVASGSMLFEFASAYLDGGTDIRNDIQNDGNGHFTYTFASAGTHVITFTRENDPYLQGWLQDTDMYSFTGRSDNSGWGFHENVFNGSSNLSSITMDAHCDQYSSGSFNGLNNLVLLNMYRLNDSPYPGGDFPSDVQLNPGTLHIPSGTTGDYQSVIAGLGSNWTVVDDL